jgi:hypothetical protein
LLNGPVTRRQHLLALPLLDSGCATRLADVPKNIKKLTGKDQG